MSVKNKDIYSTYFKAVDNTENKHKCLECNVIIHQNIQKG